MRRKLYLIGLDGMMYPMYERFAKEGVIPNIQRLADRGMATEVYCSLPSYTPTNWATLMTGGHGARRRLPGLGAGDRPRGLGRPGLDTEGYVRFRQL